MYLHRRRDAGAIDWSGVNTDIRDGAGEQRADAEIDLEGNVRLGLQVTEAQSKEAHEHSQALDQLSRDVGIVMRRYGCIGGGAFQVMGTLPRPIVDRAFRNELVRELETAVVAAGGAELFLELHKREGAWDPNWGSSRTGKRCWAAVQFGRSDGDARWRAGDWSFAPVELTDAELRGLIIERIKEKLDSARAYASVYDLLHLLVALPHGTFSADAEFLSEVDELARGGVFHEMWLLGNAIDVIDVIPPPLEHLFSR